MKRVTIQLHPKVCLEETLSDEGLSDKMLHEIREARLISLKSLVSRSYWRRARVYGGGEAGLTKNLFPLQKSTPAY
jgi:hypothetical protein